MPQMFPMSILTLFMVIIACLLLSIIRTFWHYKHSMAKTTQTHRVPDNSGFYQTW